MSLKETFIVWKKDFLVNQVKINVMYVKSFPHKSHEFKHGLTEFLPFTRKMNGEDNFFFAVLLSLIFVYIQSKKMHGFTAGKC